MLEVREWLMGENVEIRGDINKRFSSVDFGTRRQWLDGHVNKMDVKRRTKQFVVNEGQGPHGEENEENEYENETIKGGSSRRSMSRQHTLPNLSGIKIQVCKTTFLSTLGLKNANMIQELFRAKVISFSNMISPSQDGRGKQEPRCSTGDRPH